jgi:hypothetical protein
MSIVPPTSPAWQEEKRLASGDRIWIITNVEVRWSRYQYNSPDQQWFHVGAFDINTGSIGLFRFAIDDAFPMVKAGLLSPPWTSPLPVVIELHRRSHGDQEKGRFITTATLDPVDPALLAIVPHAKRMFANANLAPNLQPGSWRKLELRAARENKIEGAILAQSSSFGAGEIIAATSEKRSAVGSVLKRLVLRHKLIPDGKGKRWTTYTVAPIEIAERVDWTR